jgi:hypothetical protein
MAFGDDPDDYLPGECTVNAPVLMVIGMAVAVLIAYIIFRLG